MNQREQQLHARNSWILSILVLIILIITEYLSTSVIIDMISLVIGGGIYLYVILYRFQKVSFSSLEKIKEHEEQQKSLVIKTEIDLDKVIKNDETD